MSRRLAGCAPAAMILTALAGCDARDVTTCETVVRQQLVSPSTYRRVGAVSSDGPPMTLAEMTEEIRRSPPIDDLEAASREIVDRRLAGHRLALRTTEIRYDAANSYGAVVRGTAQCAFRLVDGQLQSRQVIDDEIVMIGYRDSVDRRRAVAAALGRRGPHTRPGKAPYACCVL